MVAEERAIPAPANARGTGLAGRMRLALLAAAAFAALGAIGWAQYRAGQYPAPFDWPGLGQLDGYLTRTFNAPNSLAFAIPIFIAAGVAFALVAPRRQETLTFTAARLPRLRWAAAGLAGGIAWLALMALLASDRYEPWFRWLFLFSAALVAAPYVASDLRQRAFRVPRLSLLTWLELAALAALIGTFIGINVRDLESWRYAAIGDDGVFYEFAHRIAHGETWNWFSQRGPYTYHPVLSSAYQALSLRLFGDDMFGWKMASVVAIAVSIALVFWLASELFSSRVGLLAAMFTAVSHYLFAYAHTGYNNVFPLVPTLAALAFLTSGLKRGHSSLLFAAGACSGLGFYTYYSSRATIAIVAVAVAMSGWRQIRPATIVPIVGGFAVFVTPIFAVDGRLVIDAMIERSASNSNDPLTLRAFDNLGRTFFAFNYNPDTLHYTAGPLLDGISATLAIAGIAVALMQPRVYGHRLVVAWFLIATSVAGVFSEYNFVSISRMHYALPCVAIFAALAVDRLLAAIEQVAPSFDPRVTGLGAVAVMAPLLFIANGDRFFNYSARHNAGTPESVILRELTSAPCGDVASASIVYAEGPVLPQWWHFFDLQDRRPVHIYDGLAPSAYQPYPLTGGVGCVLAKDASGQAAGIMTRLAEGAEAAGQPYVGTVTDASGSTEVTRATVPQRVPIRADALAAAWRTVPGDAILAGLVKASERDALPPIDNPGFVAAGVGRIDPSEPVIVVEGANEERAYPLSYLITTGVVNDTIDGRPIAVTFDAISAMPQVFRRDIDGRELRFALTGFFLHGNALLYDRETETWWQQGTGAAVAGEYAGQTLEAQPFMVASFGAFRFSFEDGRLLARTYVQGENLYRGYDSLQGKPLFFEGTLDRRLRPMQRVAMIEINGRRYAIPLPEGRANTSASVASIGGRDFALFFDAGTATPLQESYASDARSVGSLLAFAAPDGLTWRRAFSGERFTTRFADQNESVWNIFGHQPDAVGQAERMMPLSVTQGFWFAVAALYPGIEILTLD